MTKIIPILPICKWNSKFFDNLYLVDWLNLIVFFSAECTKPLCDLVWFLISVAGTIILGFGSYLTLKIFEGQIWNFLLLNFELFWISSKRSGVGSKILLKNICLIVLFVIKKNHRYPLNLDQKRLSKFLW